MVRVLVADTVPSSLVSFPFAILTPHGTGQIASGIVQSYSSNVWLGEQPRAKNDGCSNGTLLDLFITGHKLDRFSKRLPIASANSDLMSSGVESGVASILGLPLRGVGIQYSAGSGIPKALHSRVKSSDSFLT